MAATISRPAIYLFTPGDTCARCAHFRRGGRVEGDTCSGILPTYIDGVWHRLAPVEGKWAACAAFVPKLDD